MSVKVPFTVMSDEKCNVVLKDKKPCGRQIKENVARRAKKRPLICYSCYRQKRMLNQGSKKPV